MRFEFRKNKDEKNIMPDSKRQQDEILEDSDEIVVDSRVAGSAKALRANEYVQEHCNPNIEAYDIKREISNLSYKMDALLHSLSELKEDEFTKLSYEQRLMQQLDALANQQSVVENQQDIIKKQHDAMLKYNDDVIYKTQKGLILEMIEIADHVRMVMQNKIEDPDYDLMEGLKEIEEGIEASLSNNSVRRYSHTYDEDGALNRKRQTAVGIEFTSNVGLDGHYKSIVPGYEWTMPYLVVNSEVKLNKILEENKMPQSFSFVIRPEEVVKLKYHAPKEDDIAVENLENNDIDIVSHDDETIAE